MEKVYCKNCKFDYYGCFCKHPSSIIEIDFSDGKLYRLNKFSRNFPNKIGDCKYYIKKWWKFWIK